MTTRIHDSTATPFSAKPYALRALFSLFSLARERRHLVRLDDHLLRDIGVSRDEAATEASRASWDAPAHWIGGRGGRA